MQGSRSSRAAAGAAWGVVFWSAYGIVEYLLYSVYPLFKRSRGVFTLTAWRLTGVLFDCYWIVGAVAGALIAMGLARWSVRQLKPGDDAFEAGKLPAALSLLTALTMNFLRAVPVGHYGFGIVGVMTVLGAAILWVMRRPDSWLADWVDFNPFLLALLVLSPLWVASDFMDTYPRTIRFAGSGLVLIALPLINWMLRRAPRWPAHFHFVSSMVVLAAIVIVGGFKSGEGHQLPAVVAPGTPNPGRPPVILVSLDTMRADHTSLAGYSRNTTPSLVEFARGATVFPNALAAYDMTLGSHASMFTGVYPSWHGAVLTGGRPRPLDDRLPTLAGMLSRKGYFTGAIIANTAFLTPRWGLARGFHLYDTESSVTLMAGEWPFELRQGLRAMLEYIMPTSDFDLAYRDGEQINSSVFRTLSDPNVRNRSFFLFVNYMDAHSPFLPPAPYDSAFLDGQPRVPFSKYAATRQHADQCSSSEFTRLAAQYDGGVAYADHSFGQLVKWLKGRGLYDQALIIVTSDHGEVLGERGQLGHGISVYSEELDVPMLIKFPHQTAGAVINAEASHVDFMPTILDVLGYNIPEYVQGRSLAHPERLGPRAIMGEGSGARAMLLQGLKLIVNSSGGRELYALDRDRAEAHNIYGSAEAHPELVEAALREWQRRLPKTGSQGAAGVGDPEELRKLKSLGYLQ